MWRRFLYGGWKANHRANNRHFMQYAGVAAEARIFLGLFCLFAATMFFIGGMLMERILQGV